MGIDAVGNVNLFSVQGGAARCAKLGYRIEKDDGEKGIATEAVRISLKLGAKKHNLENIIAGTSTENVASQRVLE